MASVSKKKVLFRNIRSSVMSNIIKIINENVPEVIERKPTDIL
jgi:hypothetical protein